MSQKLQLKDPKINVLPDEYLVQLAEEFDSPLYIYHAERIEQQYKRLCSAFDAIHTRFFYACKALTNINVLKLLHGLGSGLDTVSLQEVKLGLKAGFKPEDIMFTPNCVA
ncbi:MAG TPA: hypothetical protein VK084_01990, partial [Chitinophagaceae bacterium]|nr:hypothetical protein [Chitinophagaceae bacterium]